MPMTGPALANAIKSAVADVSDPKGYDAVWNAVANAIITYIQSNAVVSVTVATTGTASAQTGTGTGTIS